MPLSEIVPIAPPPGYEPALTLVKIQKITFCARDSHIDVARGAYGAMPPNYLEHIVILCFERRDPKKIVLLFV